MGKSIIIIPSRLAASRLPNKPLINIKNKTLIMHVYENALKSQVGEVFVATCDDEIASEVKKNGGKFVMTDKMHTTGTDRVCEASKKLGIQDEDIVINVQGDEPMISPIDIKNLNIVSRKLSLDISTLAHKIKKKNDYKNENIVKVVTKNKVTNKTTAEALNFYRIINPNKLRNIYHHIGVYLYKFSSLKKFVKLRKSKEELSQRLEQLRAVDNNMKINVLLANYFSSGIDTKKDLDEYIKLLNK